MSNSLTGFSSTILGWDANLVQAELDRLLTPPTSAPTPFSAFATLFSNIPSPTGTINVPVPSYPTGSVDLSSGITVLDASATTIALTVNRDAGVFYAFNPSEVQAGGLSNFISTYVGAAIYGCEATLMSASFAILPSFATSSVKPAVATSMSASAVVAFNAELSNAGINGERVLVLNSSNYWSGVINDLSTKGNQAGADAIRTGSPNNPFNMLVSEAQLLPTVGNLVGFGGTKGGIVVGTAIPNVKHANGEALVVTSPKSGLPVLVEAYYDEYRRKWLVGASLLYNVALGNTVLKRIVSS